MQYWVWGDMTGNAVRTFQACSGIKETGVCEENTWKALLGNQDAVPNDLLHYRKRLVAELIANGELEENIEDITEGGADGKVWLLGEQRWER